MFRLFLQLILFLKLITDLIILDVLHQYIYSLKKKNDCLFIKQGIFLKFSSMYDIVEVAFKGMY